MDPDAGGIINHRPSCTLQRHDHRILPAAAKVGTSETVGKNLFEQPEVRHDRKAHADEVRGRMGKGAQFLEPASTRPSAQFVDDLRPYTMPAYGTINGQRAHLRHARTERRQLGAADDPAA